MKGYILRWNPNISSWTDERHELLMEDLRDDDGEMNWSIYDFEDLHEGDFFLLQRVGSTEDGIAALGTFCSEPYTDTSWKRHDGTNLFYADMDTVLLIDRRKVQDAEHDAFSAAHLEAEFPQIDWHKGHSGVLIPDDCMEGLITALSLGVFALNKSKGAVAFARRSVLRQWMCDRINEYCPALRSRVIAEHREQIVWHNFKPTDTLDESLLDLTYNESALKESGIKCAEDLARCLVPRA